MTKTTVDVIYSTENGNLPIILEVIDTEDVEYTIERQEYWSRWYECVEVAAGIHFNKK